MLNKLTSIIIPIGLILIGFQFMRDYWGSADTSRKSELEMLVSDGMETTGTLAEGYTEHTVKIAKIPIKTYEVDYTYSVGGTTYEGNQRLNVLPQTLIVKVTFLPDDPQINALNPKRELDAMTEREGSIGSLLIGLAMFLVGCFWGYGQLKSLKTLLSGSPSETIVQPMTTQAKDKSPIAEFRRKEAAQSQKPSPLSNTTESPSKVDKKPSNESQGVFSNRSGQDVSNESGKYDDLKEAKDKDWGDTDHSKYLPS